MSDRYDALKLENQLCFPLYAASREIIKQYHPYLSELGITYTQYIALMVLWETEQIGVKELGQKLYLDSGTLTPLLKTMERKGLVVRRRSEADERRVVVTLTDAGRALREQAVPIPVQVRRCVDLSGQDAIQLYTLLYRLLGDLTQPTASDMKDETTS